MNENLDNEREIGRRTLEEFYAVGLAPSECDRGPYTFLVDGTDPRSFWFPCEFHDGFFAGFDEARRLADISTPHPHD